MLKPCEAFQQPQQFAEEFQKLLDAFAWQLHACKHQVSVSHDGDARILLVVIKWQYKPGGEVYGWSRAFEFAQLFAMPLSFTQADLAEFIYKPLLSDIKARGYGI